MAWPERRAFAEAKAVRFDWKLGASLLDPFELATKMGLQVVAVPLGDDSPVEGVYLRRAGRGFILVNSSKAYRRQRLTCAHEIGHHVLLGEGDEFDLIEGPDQVSGQGDPEEREAFWFASELLMPEIGVRPLVKGIPGLEDRIGAVVRAYDVSAQSAAIRLSELNVLSDVETKAFLAAIGSRDRWLAFVQSQGIHSNDGSRRGRVRLPPAFRDCARALFDAGVLSRERYEELVERELPVVD
jgi:Zn-dependent peptidase ImmA (M78 family)